MNVVSELTLRRGQPAASPVLGLPIPVSRTIPMDVHAVMDYASGIQALTLSTMAKSPAACWANGVLGSKALAISLLTDYRLSVAKLIPIEVHEMSDHLFGFSMIAAPFVFGYWKTEPVIASMQVFVGATTVLASLFTDYRAQRGIRWGLPFRRRMTVR